LDRIEAIGEPTSPAAFLEQKESPSFRAIQTDTLKRNDVSQAFGMRTQARQQVGTPGRRSLTTHERLAKSKNRTSSADDEKFPAGP
jgi:hypothetical protein